MFRQIDPKCGLIGHYFTHCYNILVAQNCLSYLLQKKKTVYLIYNSWLRQNLKICTWFKIIHFYCLNLYNYHILIRRKWLFNMMFHMFRSFFFFQHINLYLVFIAPLEVGVGIIMLAVIIIIKKNYKKLKIKTPPKYQYPQSIKQYLWVMVINIT